MIDCFDCGRGYGEPRFVASRDLVVSGISLVLFGHTETLLGVLFGCGSSLLARLVLWFDPLGRGS